MSIVRVAWFALLVTALCGCRLTHEIACCRCDEQSSLTSREDCRPDEMPAAFCPNRSACAIAYYTGEGPARCCKLGCDAQEIYQDDACGDDDVYLHECLVDSSCYQRHIADLRDQPFVAVENVSAPIFANLTGLWIESDTQVWAVGQGGAILRHDGAAWQTVESPVTENLSGVWGRSATDIWASGWNGTVLHFDGQQWQKVDVPTEQHLLDISGTDSGTLWAVGGEGAVLHYDGQAWQPESAPTTEALTAVAARSTVWACGFQGTVLERTESGWLDRRIDLPESQLLLTDVYVDPADRVWVVGEAGAIFTREKAGEIWQREFSDAPHTLMAVGQASQTLWAVGLNGTIIRRESMGWSAVSYFNPLPGAPLLAVDASASHLWVLGGFGVSLRVTLR